MNLSVTFLLRLLPLVFLLFSSSLFSQAKDGFSKMKKKDFDGARTAFEAAILKPDEKAPALWGLTNLYADSNFAQHDFEKATSLREETVLALKSNKDTKLKGKWVKQYDLSTTTLSAKKTEIGKLWAGKIGGTESLREMDNFLATKPRLNYKNRQVIEKKHSALRRSALKKQSDFDSQAYFYKTHRQWVLDSFPSEIKDLEARLFDAYSDKNGWNKLGGFFSDFPEHSYSKDPKLGDFKKALDDGGLAAYLAFLTNAEGSVLEQPARQRATGLIKINPPTDDFAKNLPPAQRDLFDDLKYDLYDTSGITSSSVYEGENLDNWAAFIRHRMGKTAGNNALYKVLDWYIEKKDWATASKVLREHKGLFPNNLKWNETVLGILEAPDTGERAVEIGKSMNSPFIEIIPFPTADGRFVYFCGKNRPDNIDGEDIFVSEWKNGQWTDAKIVKDLSFEGNQACIGLTLDGNSMYIFNNGVPHISKKTTTGWSEAKPLDLKLSPFNWVGKVQFSANGEVAIFEARTGLSTSTDFYITKKSPAGDWDEATKLEALSTAGEERFPYLHADGNTLYFSSNGLPGLGDMDVFKAIRLDDTWLNWSEPVNLGKNINTTRKEWGYIIVPDGKTAWFNTNLDKEGENDNIFTITLPEAARPASATVSRTVVFTDKDGKPIDTQVSVRHAKTSEQLGRYQTEPSTGTVVIQVPENQDVLVTPESPGVYAPPVEVSGKAGKEATKTVPVVLRKVADLAGSKEDLFTDVLFDIGKADLRKTADGRMKELAGFLKREQLAITLKGHTDNVGEEADNLSLSKKRAEAVQAALVKHGVLASKIKAEGMGESQPICNEDTDACRKQNRRVEIEWKK